MATFPTLSTPSFGTEVEVYKPQVRNEFEGGYVQSRARASREVRRWTLKWRALPEADYQTLATFFAANQGNFFDWTEPVTSVAYTCRFSGDSLRSSHVDKGSTNYRSVEVGIEEV